MGFSLTEYFTGAEPVGDSLPGDHPDVGDAGPVRNG